MKKKVLLIVISLISLAFNAQILYSDSFDEGIRKVNSNAAYAVSLNSNRLVINGNGSARAFQQLQYTPHNTGANTILNVASNPTLYIKAKGTNNPELRIDLQDTNGYKTNLNATTVNITNEYKVYELNFNGKLFDGAFGGTCTTSPCNVDPTRVNKINLFIDASTGNYNGIVDIDWISIGAPLETSAGGPEFSVRYNQVGYFIDQQKLISINAPNNFSGKSYRIYNGNNELITSGTTGTTKFWNDAREYVATIDVTDINTEGTYRFSIDELDINFKVGNDIYKDIADATFKYYYYNRASTAIIPEFGGIYTREAGHPDTNVTVHSSAASSNRPTGTKISAPKGWYDAGDFGKYVVNSGISTYTLLAAYEHYKEYYDNKTFDIPEQTNGLPDILDEIIWNLDWMLAMQDPNDGGVYHKLTAKRFSGSILPKNHRAERFVVQKSTAAALNLAAVTAAAARIFENFEAQKPGYSQQLLDASKSAYNWAKNNPTIYFSNPSDVVTGEYGDRNVTDEFFWAASELFITTLEDTYKNDINLSSFNADTPVWFKSETLAAFSLLHAENELEGSINLTSLKNTFLTKATSLKNRVNNSAMNITINSFPWGSNSVAANEIFILLRAYETTNDISFLNAAYTATDYLLGRNGTGFCYVSGFGDKRVLNPHHRISKADGIRNPLPGMVAGGPNPGQQDKCSGYPNNFPASSFVDSYCSYASNEVTINWNAPTTYLLNALQNYQTGTPTLSLESNTITKSNNILTVYPNPSSGKLFFNSFNTSLNVSVFNLQGRQLASKTISKDLNSMDIGHLKAGVYFLKINGDGINTTKKIIKE